MGIGTFYFELECKLIKSYEGGRRRRSLTQLSRHFRPRRIFSDFRLLAVFLSLLYETRARMRGLTSEAERI